MNLQNLIIAYYTKYTWIDFLSSLLDIQLKNIISRQNKYYNKMNTFWIWADGQKPYSTLILYNEPFCPRFWWFIDQRVKSFHWAWSRRTGGLSQSWTLVKILRAYVKVGR